MEPHQRPLWRSAVVNMGQAIRRERPKGGQRRGRGERGRGGALQRGCFLHYCQHSEERANQKSKRAAAPLPFCPLGFGGKLVASFKKSKPLKGASDQSPGDVIKGTKFQKEAKSLFFPSDHFRNICAGAGICQRLAFDKLPPLKAPLPLIAQGESTGQGCHGDGCSCRSGYLKSGRDTDRHTRRVSSQ